MSARACGAKRSWLWVVVLLSWAAVPSAGAVEATRLTASSQRLWNDTVRLVESGQFEAAAANLEQLERLGPDGARVAGWLRHRHDMQQTRREMTQADLDKYVGWSKERIASGQIKTALGAAVRAFACADDKDSFRREPWLLELKGAALARAARLRGSEEWLDAHSLYYELSILFERDKEIKRLRRECLTHARLEVIYKPDESNPRGRRWEEYLQGIEWRMVSAALHRIDKIYVTEVDFRKLTVAGLEQLVLLVRSSAVQEVFDSLKDELLRDEFIQRIEERIGQLRRMDRVSRGDAVEFFQRVRKINRDTVKLPEPLMVSEFTNGAVETLDEFTSMIWPVEYREFDKHTRGDFIGVGISIQRKDNEITVVTPLEDSPAYEAGIMANDVIVKVDGQSTEGMSLTKAVETITGPIKTTVVLTVRRAVDGVDTELVFPLERKKVVIQSVKGFRRNLDDPQGWDCMMDREAGIGYIRLVAFQNNTVEHLQRTIEKLQASAGFEGLILDLRFNPGGLLRSAVDITELFLHEGDKIVSTKGERTPEYPIVAQETGPFVDLPLVVLINESSASASEIVSGALKDHKRATIIGQRTFGKFSVQNLVQLDGSDAHLKLTTAAYYLPSGKSLHRTEDATEWGVEPDIHVKVVPKEMAKIYAMRRKADVLGPRGSSAAEEDSQAVEADDRAGEEPKPDADPEAKPDAAGDAPEAAAPDADPDGEDQEPAQGDEPKKDGDEQEDEQLPLDPNERPEIDPQIETALLVLRVYTLNRHDPQLAFQAPDRASVDVK